MRISRRQQRNHRTVGKSGGVKLRLVVRRRGGGGNFSGVARKKPKNVSTQAEQLKNMCPARRRRQHRSPKPFQ